MSNFDSLIVAKDALRRCGYKHRNSLPALTKFLPVIKRNGRNYFRESDINRYVANIVPNTSPEVSHV